MGDVVVASPQKEHGFTPIANELLRALIKQELTGHQWRVLMAIALDSFGQQRKESHLSINQIAILSDLRRERVRESLQTMVGRRIVLPGGGTVYRPTHQNVRKINKDYDGWGRTETTPRTLERPTPRTLYRPTLERAHGIEMLTSTSTSTPRKQNVNRKNHAITDSRVSGLIKDFFKRLETTLGEKPKAFNGGAAGRIFAHLLRDYPPEKITDRVASWFDSSDPFIAKNGWRIEMFAKYFNTLKGGPIHAQAHRAGGGYIGASPTPGKYAALTNRRKHAG